MPDVPQTLAMAGISASRAEFAPARWVYLTVGNQLIGRHRDLKEFREVGDKGIFLDPDRKGILDKRDIGYQGWESHHVVEKQDLQRLHVAERSPAYEDQLCVLIPKIAHGKRVNGILRSVAPVGGAFTPRELLAAYDTAYEVLGDYSGGGERLIRHELVSIVQATFRAFDLI